MPARQRLPRATPRRRLLIGAITRAEAARCFLAAALPPALISAPTTVPAFLHGELAEPDTYMRLVRIEQGLAAGRIAHAVARDGSGAGTVLHWSHLLDSLLVLVAAPLAPLIGWHGALFLAATIAGPLSAGLVGVAIAWAVAPGVAPRWRPMAPLAFGMTAAALAHGRFGVAHHHLPLLAALALVLGWLGRAALGRPDAVRRAGIAAAAALWLTPEAVPLLLVAFAWPLLLWWLHPRAGPARAATQFGTAATALLALAWLVDPPLRRFALEIDRLSLVHVAFGAALAATGLILLALARARLSTRQRRIVALLLAPAPLLAWFAAFPDVLRGPDGLADGAALMFADVAEMLPVQGPAEASLYLLAGALATLFAAGRAIAARSLSWAYAAAASALFLALGAWHVRFAAYPEAAAAATLPFAVAAATRLRPPILGVLARTAAWSAVILLPLLPTLSESAPPPSGKTCRVRDAAPLLAPFPGAIVLSSPNDVPELLYRTPVLTVGSIYHRNTPAFLRLRAAWRSAPSPTVPDAVRATGATLVLACPGAPRLRFLADLPPNTLWDRLNAGLVPPWLEEVARAPDSAPSGAPILYRLRSPP